VTSRTPELVHFGSHNIPRTDKQVKYFTIFDQQNRYQTTMPRVRDMKKMVNTLVTVESVDSRQQAQYSDDEKTTMSSRHRLGSSCVRSAIKGVDGRGRKMPRQKRSLRFDPYDEGKCNVAYSSVRPWFGPWHVLMHLFLV
jgi:hypothetical protein